MFVRLIARVPTTTAKTWNDGYHDCGVFHVLEVQDMPLEVCACLLQAATAGPTPA